MVNINKLIIHIYLAWFMCGITVGVIYLRYLINVFSEFLIAATCKHIDKFKSIKVIKAP